MRFTVEGGAVTVFARRLDLERMVRNLLENAVRHSPEGGEVRITIDDAEATVSIAVADDGPGVPESERPRIFEPFFRSGAARTDASGSGLGLPIAREVARAHGGDVVLAEDAGPGRTSGARFVATVSRLPCPH